VPNIEARLGALYSLERLLSESQKDQRTILETLCAYIRENACYDMPTGKDTEDALITFLRGDRSPSATSRADVQAALTIIGRRPVDIRERAKHEGWRLDLSKTNLIGYDFSDLNCDGARFVHSFLNFANMSNATFDGCAFENSFLRGAKMIGASLRSANLINREVTRAEIEKTNFDLATVVETDLRKANVVSFSVRGANLEQAFNGFLEYAIKHLKDHGPDSVSSAEILGVYQLFQKATYDEATKVSEGVRDAILIMRSADKQASP
jgi:hypothetical protein